MSRIGKIIRLQFAHSPVMFCLGVLAALVPAVSGIALLGVAGWFITAAAVAGLAGAFLNLIGPSALIRVLAIVRTAGRYGERMLTHDATFRFLANLRNRIFRHYASRPFGRTVGRSGVILNRLTTDIAALDTVYLRILVPGVVSSVIAVGLVVFCGLLAWQMLLAAAGFVAGCAIVAVYGFAGADRKNARRLDAASEAMRLRSVDLVSGRKDLAVYGGLERKTAAILKADERLSEAETHEERRTIWLIALAPFAGQIFQASVLVTGVWLVSNGTIGFAGFATALLAAFALPEVIAALLPGLSKIPRIDLAARRVASGMEGPASVQEKCSEKAAKGQLATPPVLYFDRISFAYPGAVRPVLEDFSFSIANGETLAIVGRSGRGKSTVVSLAAGLLTPDLGTVRINGLDIAFMPEAGLRKAVTVISQRPYLFNDTIAANLRIANPDASDADLWEALEAAALDTRIRSSLRGLASVLGEGGLGLSGGEQRRLGLARAYLTKPVLFVLDEMTEGLDDATAKDVLERFLSFKKDAAALLIAHKAHEIERADRVLSMSETGICLAAE